MNPTNEDDTLREFAKRNDGVFYTHLYGKPKQLADDCIAKRYLTKDDAGVLRLPKKDE